MDPSILSSVLGLDPAAAEQRKSDFDLRPAYIVGYECKLWGPYPALVDGPESGSSSIDGAVFQVRTVEEGRDGELSHDALSDTIQGWEAAGQRDRVCVFVCWRPQRAV